MGESLLARKVREFGGYAQLVDAIGPERAFKLANTWRAIARPEQLLPGSADAAVARAAWRTWLLLAGRGFGKTRTGAETVDELVDQGRARSIALIAPTYKAVRRLMIEHPVSGILARSSAWNRPVWKKDDGELHWPNGAIAYVYTAEEPDGPRGFNGDLAWCEEVGSWQYPNETWANLQLGLRIRSRLKEMCDWVRIDGPDTREVGPHPSDSDIARWQESSPASPKNRARGGLPQKSAGQARAQLKPRERDGRADLKWPGGRAGS